MRKLALAALLLAAGAVSAAEVTETIDRTFDARPGASLVLSNVNGHVKVTAWDQPKIRVIAKKEVEADRDEAQAVLRALRVELQPRDGGLVVTTHHPKNVGASGLFDWLLRDRVQARVRYDITVPRSMNVEVENVNGAIHLSGVNGKHELDTTNGAIQVARCAGSLDASTTNGAIRAELTNVAKGQPLRFETTNGRIEVALPASLALDVDAGTTNGAIRSELPVTTTRIGKNSLRGSINGGGTPLKLRTTNGAIAIRTVAN